MFTVSLIPYGKDGKPIAGKKTAVGSDWGLTPEMRTWERRVTDLELEGLHMVELEIEIARADSSQRGSSLRLDNIIVIATTRRSCSARKHADFSKGKFATKVQS